MEGPKGFRAMLAGWALCGFVTIVEDEIRFWNGAKIFLCHCKDEKDVYKYQGAEIHVLLIDELTHFSESMYRFLRNRVRMVGLTIPDAYAGSFPRILCGANPGNIGHLWVKTTFVVAAPEMSVTLTAANDGGMRRQYIPARLEDNPSMVADDPGYEMRLEGLGSAELVKAMRWGDWDVIEGAFFDCWDRARHVVTPFAVPASWMRFRSGDAAEHRVPVRELDPGLDPVRLVDAHHDAGLIVQLAIRGLHPQLGREIAGRRDAEQVPRVPGEAVMRLAPEIGASVRRDEEGVPVEPPRGGFVQPGAARERHPPPPTGSGRSACPLPLRPGWPMETAFGRATRRRSDPVRIRIPRVGYGSTGDQP